ncbi:MAG: hypothetical protein ABIQ31_08565 [Ferruginibacter sp.]
MKVAGLIFLLLPLNMYCQDLTGTWTGREGGTSYLKLVIIQRGDSCFGYTYDKGPGFCKANFAGSFDKNKRQLKGKGINFIDRSFGHLLAVYDLKYTKDGNDEYLDGRARAKGVGSTMLSFGIPSFVELKKITTAVDTTTFTRSRILAFQNRPTNADTPQQAIQNTGTADTKILTPDSLVNVKKERVSKMIQTIFTNADTVQISLYDNGVVDDDTVTVFFDDAVILERYRITDKAKMLSIPLTKNGRSHVIELFANNLGTIPPNTALIIIMAGKERYEVHAAYDLSTNAKIIFQFKE